MHDDRQDDPVHADVQESLGAFVLRALPEDEARLVRDHLEACARCRDEAAALQPAVDALALAAPPTEPPPELKDRVMAVVDAEARLLRAAGADADRAPARRRRLPRLAARPALAAGAAAAALAAVFAGGVVVGGGDNGGSSARTVAARVTDPGVAHTARASLRTSSAGQASLVVSGLPSPGHGRVYQLWVQRASGPPRSAGTFDLRSGSVEVPVSLHGVQRVMVSSEPAGGSVLPTRQPLIIARTT